MLNFLIIVVHYITELAVFKKLFQISQQMIQICSIRRCRHLSTPFAVNRKILDVIEIYADCHEDKMIENRLKMSFDLLKLAIKIGR